MDKQKKSLLCMYVDDFCGIKEESFNFYIERRYTISEGKISRKSDEEIKDFPKDFWGDNVSAVTLLIGENGAGKTTLMRLLIKWLCQLSAGNFPLEKGALVINEESGDNDYNHGNRDKLIAFEKGQAWTIEINKCKEIVCIEDRDEIMKLLSDIYLAYYTDTMTDLELSNTLKKEELAFLQDDSLLTRLSNSIGGNYTVDSIKDCIKREDFRRQMKLFLSMFSYNEKNPDTKLEFPIRYMKLTALKPGDKEGFKGIPDGNDSLVGEAIDLWNQVFSDAANNNLPDIAKDLLWGLFSGTITSLLRWERTLPNQEEHIVTEKVRGSLRAYIRNNRSDWNVGLKRFFKNMFGDCERGFQIVYRNDRFRAVWSKQLEDDIESFLDALKKIKKGKLLDKWKLSENAQNVWEFRLEYFDEKGNKDEKDKKDKKGENENSSLIQDWEYLWEHYLEVARLMPECRFDWKYASSGGKNKINLYAILFNIISENKDSKINQLWVLLDEPDNTFHPDWKRRIIRNLLEICSAFKINFQLLISTHSPIMLSDVPKQAAILMKICEKDEDDNTTEEKKQRNSESSPFGQQIYTLFNDAFFMKHGIVGEFANMKIGEIFEKLSEREKLLAERKDDWNENELNSLKYDLEYCECIIKLIEEPLLHGYLSQSYKLCKRIFKELLKNYLREEGVLDD